uniref:ATP synthase F0 subunit 8 n=1 Tax=Histampica haimaensis TaxID=2839059 RepID=A0A8K1K741_9ECHI|nr:ATP synthase F0 subunit 8 [Histampica sp. h LQ-2021]WKW95571.1 ATP synthase F0 subunit 8 [Histampica sp. CS049]
MPQLDFIFWSEFLLINWILFSFLFIQLNGQGFEDVFVGGSNTFSDISLHTIKWPIY